MEIRAGLKESKQVARDRELIRINLADERMGIAAALRRAFDQAAHEPCDRDFEELLRQLN